MFQLIHKLQNIASLVFFPQLCVGCKKANASLCKHCEQEYFYKHTQCLFCDIRNYDSSICNECKRSSHTKISHILWAACYDGAIRNAITQLKYRNRKAFAPPLASMIFKKFNQLSQINAGEYICIPIPLSQKREKERGFNQAQLIAKHFSLLSGIPLLEGVMTKIRETEPQAKIPDRKTRLIHLENAFYADTKKLAPHIDKTIILIDDVATTGATLIHASHALENAGAKHIIGLVVAHGN
jgi:ComF family protein